MTNGAEGGIDEAGSGRRLTLTPIGLDIVIALGQLPDGLRLSTLAHAIGSPVSSVQAALRVLVSNGLAVRVGEAPPHYRLAAEHPASGALSNVALALPDAAHATAISARANPAVDLAVVDSAGFVLAVASTATPDDRVRLTGTLAAIRAIRPDAPPVEIFDAGELTRLLAVSIGLRDRIKRAVVLKGRVPRGSRAAGTPSASRSRQTVR
jgi:hypothetical protein